jgi:hypothetical protein
VVDRLAHRAAVVWELVSVGREHVQQ